MSSLMLEHLRWFFSVKQCPLRVKDETTVFELKVFTCVFNPQAQCCLQSHPHPKCHSSETTVYFIISLQDSIFLTTLNLFFPLFYHLFFCFFFRSGFSEFNQTKGQDVCSPGFLALGHAPPVGGCVYQSKKDKSLINQKSICSFFDGTNTH